jgi:hypothetical protein
MRFWNKLFGQGAQTSRGKSTKYKERDNRGTRQESAEQANSYWVARELSGKYDPFALYVFANEKDAREALLELECMHIAEDSGKVICTETLIFGHYKTEDGKYEVIVCGDDLSHELWETAKVGFAKYGGTKKGEQEPKKTKQTKASAKKEGNPRKVKFVREEKQQGAMGNMLTYRIYTAPDAASAKAFLEENPVTRKLYYLVVETPEGDYGRDIDGIYKE